jgi:hypothetical protein
LVRIRKKVKKSMQPHLVCILQLGEGYCVRTAFYRVAVIFIVYLV